MEELKFYKIEEAELKDLIEARAILNEIIKREWCGYAENVGEFIGACLKKYNCQDMSEVSEVWIKENEYKEIN